ncbi:hypothetical protein RHSIM_Rhsim03G0203900 [Rhododendron simsii]|uniref:Pentatricopeptide repeat-containing protein n=1 Tax=Rhododendron simsii TaxID=118357 RepID=A0A834H5M8_RHOSS|nr:hypothetical protein RHSIM_Rhsim03G0203900 [Rhododendron simsii]
MPERNSVTWTLMITRYSQMELGRLSFEQKLRTHVVKYQLAFNVYVGCSWRTCLRNVQRMGLWLIQGKFFDLLPIDNYVTLGLRLSQFTSCGQSGRHSKEAIELYCRMINVKFNLISLAEHGFAKRALQMFQEMVDVGIKPNDIIDIVILSAYRYVGMIDEGPGFFEEAMQLIDAMSFTAHVLVWRTLLGAC